MELAANAREAGRLHTGLRECLSTFSDLSPAHVVRYESYWLEDPTHLPKEVRSYCERRLGTRSVLAEVAPALGDSPAAPGGGGGLPSQPPAPGAYGRQISEGPGGDSSVVLDLSLRFREATGGTRLPRSPSCEWWGPTPSLAGDNQSCGFDWELAAADAHESPPSSPVRKVRQDPAADAPPPCAVLLIEMELMGIPPDGRNTATMEERLTLRAWLQRATRTIRDAADVFGSLMHSVRHIHRKRIVHADLKPDNIFCTVGERSKVTAVRIGDFGLAGENQQSRAFDQFSHGMLRDGGAMLGGTPGYVAPEILRSARERGSEASSNCSDKVDIFACAVVLLELLLPPLGTQMERVQSLQRFNCQKAVPDFVNARLPKTRVLLQEMGEHDPIARLSAEEVCKRFEKEVRKELCRSNARFEHCSPSPAPRCVEAQAPTSQDAAGGEGAAGGSHGRRRGGRGNPRGKGPGRRRG